MPSYALANARVGLRSNRGWSVFLFASNLLNKQAQIESRWQEMLPSASFNRIITNQPRTVGLDVACDL